MSLLKQGQAAQTRPGRGCEDAVIFDFTLHGSDFDGHSRNSQVYQRYQSRVRLLDGPIRHSVP